MSDKTELDPQENWKQKILSFPASMNTGQGQDKREEAARRWLAEEIRKLADHVESGDYPRIYGIVVPPGDKGPKFTEALMAEYRVILSHPWGG